MLLCTQGPANLTGSLYALRRLCCLTVGWARRAAGARSRVPFALRWLAAELPERLGRAGETVERLHALLELCRMEAGAAAAAQAATGDAGARSSHLVRTDAPRVPARDPLLNHSSLVPSCCSLCMVSALGVPELQ